MKTTYHIIVKEFTQILRDKSLMRMIIAIPILQLVVLVYAATMELKQANVVVVDMDKTEDSRNLINKISSSPFFNVSQTNSIEESQEYLLSDKCKSIIIIHSGFEKDLYKNKTAQVQLLINAINSTDGQLIMSYLASIVGDYNKSIIMKYEKISAVKNAYEIKTIPNFWYNPELDYKWFMAPGIMAILVTLIGMFLSAMSLVKEKEIGTIEQLNVTPIKKYQLLSGKLIPFMVVAIVDLIFGLCIAVALFNQPFVGSILTLLAFVIVYLIGMIGIGLFISTLVDTQQQVMLILYFFMLIFILMGGIFTPTDSMPQWAKAFNNINPMFYFIKVLRMILLKGSSIWDLQREFFSLLAIGIAILSVSVWKYRKTN